MMPKNLSSLSDDELVERFRRVASETGDAVVNWLPAARKTRQLFAIKNILRTHGQDSRLKLAKLLTDDDRFVKYYTALELIHLLPGRCRPIIEENTREFDAISSDARGFLRAFDEGTLPLY